MVLKLEWSLEYPGELLKHRSPGLLSYLENLGLDPWICISNKWAHGTVVLLVWGLYCLQLSALCKNWSSSWTVLESKIPVCWINSLSLFPEVISFSFVFVCEFCCLLQQALSLVIYSFVACVLPPLRHELIEGLCSPLTLHCILHFVDIKQLFGKLNLAI